MIPKAVPKPIVTLAIKVSTSLPLPKKAPPPPPPNASDKPEPFPDCIYTDAIKAIQTITSNTIKTVAITKLTSSFT